MSRFVGQTLKNYTAEVTTEALEEITTLIEAGELVPVIARSFPLEESAQAVALVEDGRPAGKVTVIVSDDA